MKTLEPKSSKALDAFLRTLRAHGVVRYESESLKLTLTPQAGDAADQQLDDAQIAVLIQRHMEAMGLPVVTS
ncbi:MAG TPA: hypothetical protein VFJ24_01630 [Gaiellales bacterium]|nr:hypothetical protein [Gaiellales bacterium]